MPWPNMFSSTRRNPAFTVQRNGERVPQIIGDIYDSVEAKSFKDYIFEYNINAQINSHGLLPSPVNIIYEVKKTDRDKVHHFCLSGDLETVIQMICNQKLATIETLNDLCQKAGVNVKYEQPKPVSSSSSCPR